MMAPAQWGFGVLYLVMLLAWCGIHASRHHLTITTFKEISNRIKTWGCIVTGLWCALYFNAYAGIAVFCCISVCAFHEYATCVQAKGRLMVAFSYLMIPIQYLWIAMAWNQMALIFVPVYMFLLLPVFLMTTGTTKGFLASLGIVYWGFVACVFCLSHVALLLLHAPGEHYNGASLVFFILLLTGANDIFQYLWGKALGRKKILPSISPNKTWAGLMGGMVTTAGLSLWVAPFFTPLSCVHALTLGLMVGMCGFLGDVCMSAIKRDLGIKDYSDALPGHGGVLDRLDSLIYTAPVFFHYLNYFYG